MPPPKFLLLEPFWGGSHRQFGQIVTEGIDAQWTILDLPAQHWKWRMRASAVQWALEQREVLEQPWDGLIASSFLPLAELRGLVPCLARVPALLYFHENQFAYPSGPTVSREAKTRDLHYGFLQLTSALAATVCGFNSAYNMHSFLAEARRWLKQMPRPRPRGWVDAVASRSRVIPLPLDLPDEAPVVVERSGPPRVLWNHRWEHDKRPEAFFDAMLQLEARGVPFRLLVTGQRFRRSPDCFATAKDTLAHRIDHWGYAANRGDYLNLLRQADLAVSTAGHEFFGIAMLEATHMGARPLVPDRLAYPELYPAEYRYADDDALVDELERLLTSGSALRADRTELTRPFGATALDELRRALLSLIA